MARQPDSDSPRARTARLIGQPDAPPPVPLSVIFCDIGDVLGTPVFSPASDALESLKVFPFVLPVLTQLKSRGHRIGIISNTGTDAGDRVNAVLKKAGLYDLLDPALLVYSSDVKVTKASPEIFQLAAKHAGVVEPFDRCLYVGDDPQERSVAARAGFRVAIDLTRLGAVLANVLPARPDIRNLDACIEDVRLAALRSDTGPDDPTEYHTLLGRLETARLRLPPIYRDTVFLPFVAKLHQLGPSAFSEILLSDPHRVGAGSLMMDIAHAILQNGERYEEKATDAFEEVVSDLYDGFLSAQERRGIKAPDRVVLAPLVKWGNPESGPYTWPADAASEPFGVGAAIVSLPPANAHSGLMAWGALGHETAGHDILHADNGLQAELANEVQTRLEHAHLGFGLPEYWSSRIDETASDVLGILNMGPAAGIGLIAYFRGLSAAAGDPPRLRTNGPSRDPHPADIVRGYLAAATVRLLSFDGASDWANTIDQETDRDLGPIRLAGVDIPVDVAKRSAEIVASAIASGKMAVLNGHALIEIQDWRNRDEEVVQELRGILTTTAAVSVELASGVYAAHVVSAAVTAGLANGAHLPALFSRMLAVLKAMHDQNPSWGPLFITHPSTISRNLVYVNGGRA